MIVFKMFFFIKQHLVRWTIKKITDEYNASACKSKGIYNSELRHYKSYTNLKVFWR